MQEHAALGARAWQAGDPETALTHLEAAWETNPALHPDLSTLLALVLVERGQSDRALSVLRSAILRWPDHRGLLDGLGSLLLSLERWPEGWAVWARSLGGAERHLRPWLAGLTHWQGEPLGTRTLAIFPHPRCASADDILLFIRYLPCIQAEHPQARLRLVSPRPLHRLLEQSCPGVQAMLPAAAVSGASAWALLSEVPLLVGDRSGSPPPPSLRVPPDEVARARARLGILRYRGRHVGLSVLADRADDATLPPSVRTGIPSTARTTLSDVGARIVTLAVAGQRDLAELAATIGALGLVVTADNVIATLAAALGVPTWVLLPTSADWRWGPGERSAWYPSARLYRQQQAGDWVPVGERVAADLRVLAGP